MQGVNQELSLLDVGGMVASWKLGEPYLTISL